MKAMILAAGLGTRLRPLTDDRPKALVMLAGKTLLQITIERLIHAGVTEIIVNAHHFADQIENFLHAKRNFGLHIKVSREEDLLDTGGGLKHAAWFFSHSSEPFLLHNVDVISTIDLEAMFAAHRQSGALATLAVQNRKTSRYLLFDDANLLCGRRSDLDGTPEIVRAVPPAQALAFCGIHVISPQLLPRITEEGDFSIIPVYLRLAASGAKIAAFHADEFGWRDLGTPESLADAEREFQTE